MYDPCSYPSCTDWFRSPDYPTDEQYDAFDGKIDLEVKSKKGEIWMWKNGEAFCPGHKDAA